MRSLRGVSEGVSAPVAPLGCVGEGPGGRSWMGWGSESWMMPVASLSCWMPLGSTSNQGMEIGSGISWEQHQQFAWQLLWEGCAGDGAAACSANLQVYAATDGHQNSPGGCASKNYKETVTC